VYEALHAGGGEVTSPDEEFLPDRGDAHEHHAAVGGVRVAPDVAVPLQPGHQLPSSPAGLTPLAGRQVGEPLGADLVEGRSVEAAVRLRSPDCVALRNSA